MAMVINTNEQATRIRSVYNQNVSNMNAAMTRLATTRKINSAKDGAANWAISEKMRERIRANDQANQNIQNDTALLKTAQEGLGNTLNILETLKERAINSANDANISTDRLKIQAEVSQLVAQIDDNAAKVKFNDRALLNGAGEAGATAATATKKASATANVNAVTATEPQGTHSVYSIQGLKVYDTDLGELRDIANNSTNAASGADDELLLSDLKDADGNKLFKNGDKITVSWNDNGEAKEASYTVIAGEDSGNSKVSDLISFLGTSGVASESFTTATLNAPDAAVGTGIKNTEGTALTAGSAGIYFFAKDSNRKITDVAISVTNSAETDASRLENTNAVLEPVGVMQNASNGGSFTEGSNNVYAITNGVASGGSGAALLTGAAGDNTRWMDLLKDQPASTPDGKHYLYDAYVASSPKTDEDDLIELTINDKTLKFKAGTTINQLNELLADNDINARFHIAAENEVLTYDGKEVTKGDSTSTATLKAQQAGLHLIAGEGEVITEFKFANSSTDASGATNSNPATYADIGGANGVAKLTDDKMNLAKNGNAFSQQLGVANDYLNGATSTATATTKSSTANIADSMLPQGETLQFYVGGESNFGISFSIGKATVENLFGMTGEDFAAKFQTKEGAEEALNLIDDAINRTLVEQTRLGAMEARLGYTSENLTSMNTNLEAANSAYRDADIAKEMTDYMKYSVLAQSSQYMLAQATQNPFSVLQLLQP